MTLLFFSEILRWWEVQKFVVIIIKDSRALEELPIKIISSAKKIEDTLMEPRLIPEPVLFSSWPKLLTKRATNRGERLHPESMIISAFFNSR
jgi:hypothetical protein